MKKEDKEQIIVTSDDDYSVKMDKNYTLVNHNGKKENKLAEKFKNSILGEDIGIKNKGFSSMASLALVVAITVLFILYLLWRF